MAYQQQQVPCPPNAWTQISEYRPTRKSLMVQCPQVATVTQSSVVALINSVTTVLAAANSLRRSIAVGSGDIGRDTVIGPSAVIDNANSIGLRSQLATALSVGAFIANGDWGRWAQSQWYGLEMSGSNSGVMVFEEIYQCRAIILATATNAAAAGGPYGIAPPGNWLSPDLSAGPANFRLQEPVDGEQTIQAWYAWPVGSVTVNVTVSEAWTDNQPPAPPKMFRVDLPRLSTDAIAALNQLLGKMSQYDEPGADNAV